MADVDSMSEEGAMVDLDSMLAICTTADGKPNDHLCTLCAPAVIGERKTCDRCRTAIARFWTWFEVAYGEELYCVVDQPLHPGTFKGMVALLSPIEGNAQEADNLHAFCATRRRESCIVMCMFGADFCKRTLHYLVDTIDNTAVLASIVRGAVRRDYEKRRSSHHVLVPLPSAVEKRAGEHDCHVCASSTLQ